MDYTKYKNELKLIESQNPMEDEVYHLLYMLLKKSGCIEGFSLRDIHKRRKGTYGQIFYGLSSMPDFIVADLDFKQTSDIDQIDKIYGCIEAKRIGEKLLNIDTIIEKFMRYETLTKDEGQLLGELLWYKKVLYTNGKEWQFLKWKPKQDEFVQITEIVKKRIEDEKSKNEFVWYRGLNIDILKNMRTQMKENSRTKNNVLEFPIILYGEKDWRKLMSSLSGIIWND